MTLSKGPGTGLTLYWSESCSEAATNYGIYEGQLGDWQSHTQVDCTDDGGDLQETITPESGDRYLLVVPLDAAADEEGSYGRASDGVERTVGAVTCATSHVPRPCPSVASVVSEIEPNDHCLSQNDACGVEVQPILLGASVDAAIDDSCDFDVFAFSLDQTTEVSFETVGQGDTAIRLVDANCERIGCDEDSGEGYMSLLSGCLPAGSFALEIRPFDNAQTFDYTLVTTADTATGCTPTTTTGDNLFWCQPEVDFLGCGTLASLVEAQDFPDCAGGSSPLVTPGDLVTASIDPACDRDSYHFSIAVDTEVKIEGLGGADTALVLATGDCTRLTCDDDSGSGGNPPYEPKLCGCLPAGEYVVRVRAFQTATHPYELEINSIRPCNSVIDPPPTGDEAFTCSSFETCP
jgi:hypothetical protein